jgi:glycosyltransferase involved in cell wall biosynthesis
MKVFIITKEPFPNGMAATKRITCYAKGLVSAGVDCEVIVAKRTEIYGEFSSNLFPKGELFKYIGNKTQRSSNILLRKCSDYLDTLRTLRYISKNSTAEDVILNYLREDSLNELIIKAANKTGAKVVRDLCEYPLGTGKETDELKKKRDSFLKDIFPKFDGFICISQALYDLAMEYKSPKAKLIKVPILVEPEEQEKSCQISPIDSPYIFHSGTLYEQKDGILGAIEAFAIASQKLDFPIKYVLTGNILKSPDRIRIEEIIQKYDIKDKIIFTGFLPIEDLKAYQNGCTLMVVNKLENQQNTYCFATKLGEYLLSGKPVITTSVGESKYYLKDGESAYIVAPGNVQLLADKIVDAFTDLNANLRIGGKGRDVALNNFVYKIQGEKIAGFLRSL